MRALTVLALWATPALGAPCLPKEVDDGCLLVSTAPDGDNAAACFHSHCATDTPQTCLAIAPKTGVVVGSLAQLPATFEINDDEPDVLGSAAFARCGTNCTLLRRRLAIRDELVAAIDPTGKLLFEIENGYPTHGNTWSLVTGKRIARFPMDDFDGPPPPTSFDHVMFVGRHVFVGEPGQDYTLTYDIYDGAMGMLFQHRLIGRGLVLENEGRGRLDLLDYAQPNHPRLAVRRVKSMRADDDSTLEIHTVQLGDRTVVVIEKPLITLLVDGRKRTISKPRPLPRCDYLSK